MELSILQSPLFLCVIAIISIFLLILAVIDVRRTSHRRHLQRQINQYVIENALKRFSVVAELERSDAIDDVRSLIEHLTAIEYENIHLVVLVGEQVNKAVVNTIRRHQRMYRKTIAISVVRQRRGLDRTALLRRYAKSELVIWMNPSERFHQNFFRRISLEFLDKTCDAVTPRRIPRISDTLSSAAIAWTSITLDLVRGVFGITRAPIVYRRTSLLSGEPLHRTRVDGTAIFSPSRTHASTSDIVLPIILTVAIVALCFGMYAAFPLSWQLPALTIVGGILIVLGLHMSSFQYRFAHKLTLLLFLPFWPIVAAGGWIRDVMKQGVILLSQRRN
jgi:hypothetical protein